jgi:glyoxylase I family protein
MSNVPAAPAAPAVLGLHHFAWKCKDAEQTRHFYEDVLGLPLVHVIRSDRVPSTGELCPYVHLFFELADGSCVAFFDLGDGRSSAPSPNTPAWVNHLALRVKDRSALSSAQERLRASDIDVLGPTDHHFVESIYFIDPNGIRLELTAPKGDPSYLEDARRDAHAACARWTEEKLGRQ